MSIEIKREYVYCFLSQLNIILLFCTLLLINQSFCFSFKEKNNMVCLIKCFNKLNWTERTYGDYVYVLNRFSVKRAMLLEFSQYLENYLWPNFNATKVCKHAKKKAILRIVDVVSFFYAQTVNLERERNLRVMYTQIHCFVLQCSCE